MVPCSVPPGIPKYQVKKLEYTGGPPGYGVLGHRCAPTESLWDLKRAWGFLVLATIQEEIRCGMDSGAWLPKVFFATRTCHWAFAVALGKQICTGASRLS